MNESPVIRTSPERLVVAGTMGPTFHDVHAWRLMPGRGLIEVRADPDRFRAHADTTGRALHLKCGAALVNLRLAAAQLGHEPVVRLLPDSGCPALLATVRLAGRHRVTRAERLLYAATLRPLPSSSTATGGIPAGPVFNELQEVARLEGAALRRIPSDGPELRAVITTRGAAPADWLRAGQALQQVLLNATIRSVAVTFRYEPDELPSTGGVSDPGDAPQVVLELRRRGPALIREPSGLRQSASAKAAKGRQNEGKPHWERVR